MLNKISIGKIVKHEWFKKPKEGQKKEALIERKLPVEFERKDEIYSLLYELEEKRNSLMYGKSNTEQIKKVLEYFQKLKNIMEGLLKNEGQEI